MTREENTKFREEFLYRELGCEIIGMLIEVHNLINEHYNQVKRYLHKTGIKLGILVNFRDKRIKPKRVLNENNLRNAQDP